MGLLILSLSSGPRVYAAEMVDLDENILHGLIAEGGLITFGVDGTVSLSRTLNITKDTILDGSGHSVTLGGMDAVRVLYVNTNVSLTVSNVTIASGLSDRGGGLYNAGGLVSMVGCKFINNHAQGTNGTSTTEPGGFAAGGAIYNEGNLWLTNCQFLTNIASGGKGMDADSYAGPGGTSEGGAIYSLGDLWITGSSFVTNQALGGDGGSALTLGYGGQAGSGRGGAISSPASLSITSSSFEDNVAAGGQGGDGEWDPMGAGFQSGGGGADGEAGAIYTRGTLTIANCFFPRNRASGGISGSGYNSPRGGSARGGSIYNGGLLTVNSNCSFTMNDTRAGGSRAYKGGLDGRAFGGGIFNTGTLWIASALIVSNTAYSGEAAGGGIYSGGGNLDLTSSVFVGNSSVSGTAGGRYYGGPGFDSFGGAVFNAASASFSNCSFLTNLVVGGPATVSESVFGLLRSGNGLGAGLASSGLTEMKGCSFIANQAFGGPGVSGNRLGVGQGGRAGGGAVAATGGAVDLLNTTVSECSAVGGLGGSSYDYVPSVDGGPGGSALGGGIFVTNASVTSTNCTVARNTVIAGLGGAGYGTGRPGAPGTASAGGVAVERGGVLSLQNTIVSGNACGDVVGGFSGSHNLIGIDARFGAPATNALRTICLPLMPDNPAIDAALPVAGIDVDQRGVPRPFGSAPDIGAYEWNGTDFYSDFVLISLTLDNGAWRLKGGGPVNRTFRIRISSDLFNWSDVATKSSGPMGLFEYSEPFSLSESRRFYQIVAP